ncbi:MAG: hypothetical protein Q9160_001143 [Pyrenula sp. 1 TL-2023]
MTDSTPSDSNARASPLLKLPAELLVEVALANSDNPDNARDVVSLYRSCGRINQIFKSESVVQKAIEKARNVLNDQYPGSRKAEEYPCYSCLRMRHACFYCDHGEQIREDDRRPIGATSQEDKDMHIGWERICFFCRPRNDSRNCHVVVVYERASIRHTFQWCERCSDVGWWSTHVLVKCPPPEYCRRCAERDRSRLRQETQDVANQVQTMQADLTRLSEGSTTTSVEYQDMKTALEQARKVRAEKMICWQRAYNVSREGIDRFYRNEAKPESGQGNNADADRGRRKWRRVNGRLETIN